jgi:uncharacterized protein
LLQVVHPHSTDFKMSKPSVWMKEGLTTTFELTLDEGKYLVSLARRTIETSFSGEKINLANASNKIKEFCGVFVTLYNFQSSRKTLRGCIGYPYPIKPLIESVIDVAYAAAFEDPRFPRLTQKELNQIVVEISVLTPPEIINVDKPSEYISKIKIGVDGLIVKRRERSGLLLPQVAKEWNWSTDEFLSQCCIKAGLPPDSWFLPDTQIFRFQAILFNEEAPGGEVKREEI